MDENSNVVPNRQPCRGWTDAVPIGQGPLGDMDVYQDVQTTQTSATPKKVVNNCSQHPKSDCVDRLVCEAIRIQFPDSWLLYRSQGKGNTFGDTHGKE